MNAPRHPRHLWLFVVMAAAAVLAAVAAPSTESQAEEPSACAPSGAAGEHVIDFESYPIGMILDDVTVPPGIRFIPEDVLTQLTVVQPSWDALPPADRPLPSRALLNSPGDREYDSLDLPLRIGFDSLVDFVGVNVGLLTATDAFTATLTAYGLDAGGRRFEITSDSETLGPEVTPTEVCLAVSAPGQIYEVTINYNRPGGVVEPELIDNLLVRRSEAPPDIPDDETAPVVTIENPADGTLVADAFVRLQGTVTEDRDLARGELWVNGELWDDLGFSPTGEATYLFGVNAFPASELINCGDNVFEVRAWDAAGNRGTDLVHFASRVGDLEVVQAEPVQVLYGAPLIVGKATAFRLTVNSSFPCAVEAEFRLGLPDDEWDTGAPGAAAGSDVVPADWRLPDVSGPVLIPASARDLEVMLPFVAPGTANAPWDPIANPFGKVGLLRAAPRPSADQVTFWVEADPDDTLAELDEGNNVFESGSYQAITTRGVRIVFIAQAWDQAQLLANSRFATEADFIARLPGYAAEQMDYLIATYPVADAKVTWDIRDLMYYRADYQWYFEANGCWGPDPDTGVVGEQKCNPCFLALMSTSVQADESTSDAHAVALIKPWGCCGCNDSNGINSFYAEDDGLLDGNVVHELGHQDGHSGDCYACSYADGVRFGCISHGSLACESCFADEGFWVNHWQAYDRSAEYYMTCVRDPALIWSRLGPCETTRGTEVPAGYYDLIELLADEADPPAVVVRGTVSSGGTAAFAPFLRVDRAIVDLRPESTGTHAIVFLDGTGRILASHGFTPGFTVYLAEPEGAQETDTYYFSFRVAWTEGIATIELRDAAGVVLASRPVSAQTPSVDLLAPNGGDQWGQGAQAISWEGTDPDGDALFYALWISDDDGATWQPLALDITSTSYTLNTTGFPAGSGYRLKVRATDGVNTAVDESDAAFTIGDVGAPTTTQPAPATGEGKGWMWLLGGAVAAALLGAALLVVGLRRSRPRVPPGPPPAPPAPGSAST